MSQGGEAGSGGNRGNGRNVLKIMEKAGNNGNRWK